MYNKYIWDSQELFWSQGTPSWRLRASTRLMDSTDGFRDGLFLRTQDPRDQQSWSVPEILLRDETAVEGLL